MLKEMVTEIETENCKSRDDLKVGHVKRRKIEENDGEMVNMMQMIKKKRVIAQS
jgi:hypothetical protein